MKWFRQTLVPFFWLFAWSTVVSQDYCDVKYDYVWIMGGTDIDTTHDIFGGCEINFNTTPVSFNIHPKTHKVQFQNASICSKSGDLILYSNGCSIFDALDDQMEYGDSLNPGDIYDLRCPEYGYVGFQSMIFLPSSYNDSIFYLLNNDLIVDEKPNHPYPVHPEKFYAHTINMAKNNGLGAVISKNLVVFTDTSMIGGTMTATKHENGLDWWVINPNRWTNSFNKVLVDEDGPHFFEEQFIGKQTNSAATAGQAKFSPDGSVYAWYHPLNGIFIYSFDRSSGQLSDFNEVLIPELPGIIGGCEFSPSGQFLYVNHDTSLFQVDLWSQDIQASLTRIADFDHFADPFATFFLHMERTPDNRIFMNVLNGSQWLHVIQEPDKKGTACRFEQHTLKLPTVNNFTLPHFPNYRLGPLGEPLCDSIWVSTSDPGAAGEVRYRFGPVPTSGRLYVYRIDASIQDAFEVFILDMNGQMILQSNQSEIDLSGLAPGMYVCKIKDESGFVQIQKIVAIQ